MALGTTIHSDAHHLRRCRTSSTERPRAATSGVDLETIGTLHTPRRERIIGELGLQSCEASETISETTDEDLHLIRRLALVAEAPGTTPQS